MSLSSVVFMGLPLIFSCLLALFVYDVQEYNESMGRFYFYKGFMLLSVFVMISFLMEAFLRHKKTKVRNGKNLFLRERPIESKVAVLFGLVLTGLCVFDLFFRGPTLFVNPKNYDTFTQPELYLRYITIMCWTLVPIALLCTPSKTLRGVFLFTAFVFPIVAVDRNRFLTAVYAFIVVLYIMYWEQVKKISFLKLVALVSAFIALIFFFALMIFSAVGEKRSSINDAIAAPGMTSNDHTYINKEKYVKHKQVTNERQLKKLSFHPYVYEAPRPLQWFFVYSTIGVYNLAHISNIDYRDPDYFRLQFLSRFYPDLRREDLTPKPLPFPPLSAGTEFFVFFLYGGVAAVICAFLALSSVFFFYARYYSKRDSSIFLLLGYLKLTFSCLTISFGSLFFRFSHLVFLLMVIFIHNLSKTKMLRKLLRFFRIY